MIRTSVGRIVFSSNMLVRLGLTLVYNDSIEAFFNYPDMKEITNNFCVFHINAPGRFFFARFREKGKKRKRN